MLQRRLIGPALAVVALATLTACNDKTLEDNLVRPGITAMDEAQVQACVANRQILTTAIDAYELLKGEPPPDEAALVAAQYLRAETTDWNVVDGDIVAENPECGTVPEPEAVEIVTSDGEVLTADQMLAGMTDEQVASLGGVECAREFSQIVAGAEAFVAERGDVPTGFQDLVDAGYLAATPTLWQTDGEQLVPTTGGGCIPIAESAAGGTEAEEACTAAARTLEVAVEALQAMVGADPSEITEPMLVDEGMLRAELDLADLDATGAVVWAPGSGCEAYPLP